MLYRIEFKNGASTRVEGRDEVLKIIQAMPQEIADIRKIYKNGYEETVMEHFEKEIYRALQKRRMWEE